jgi:hypothetical protein
MAEEMMVIDVEALGASATETIETPKGVGRQKRWRGRRQWQRRLALVHRPHQLER